MYLNKSRAEKFQQLGQKTFTHSKYYPMLRSYTSYILIHDIKDAHYQPVIQDTSVARKRSEISIGINQGTEDPTQDIQIIQVTSGKKIQNVPRTTQGAAEFKWTMQGSVASNIGVHQKPLIIDVVIV